MDTITGMHVDLNLLRSLDALLDEQSVQGAADRLHLSQPAMSRTLARLRAATGDDILVRSGRRMLPTPHALELREEVRTLVERAGALLSADHSVPLAAVQRVFTVRGHDALLAAIAPGLVARAHEEAPGITLRFQAEVSTDSDDLRRGRIDLELGATAPSSPEIRHEIIGETTMMVALRDDHFLLRTPTAAAYARSQHVLVSRRGRLRDPVDEALEAIGLERRVVATVPAVLPALYIVEQTNAVTTLPLLGLTRLTAALHLTLIPLPIAVPPLRAVMSWHKRHDHDAALRWLREQALECARSNAN